MGAGFSGPGDFSRRLDPSVFATLDKKKQFDFYWAWRCEDVDFVVNSYIAYPASALEDESLTDEAVVADYDRWRGLAVRANEAARLNWKEFYQLMIDATAHHRRVFKERSRRTWHPATTGFTMEPDPRAAEILAEMNAGDVTVPAPALFELPYHTDDSGLSESDDSGASESESEAESVDSFRYDTDTDSSDESFYSDESDGSYYEESEEEGSGSESGSGSSEEGSDDDDDDDDDDEDSDDEEDEDSDEDGDDVSESTGDGTATTASEAALDDDQDAEAPSETTEATGGAGEGEGEGEGEGGGSSDDDDDDDDDDDGSDSDDSDASSVETELTERTEKREVHELFDCTKRSPVFFGMQLKTVAVEEAAAEAARLEDEAEESAILERHRTERHEHIRQVRSAAATRTATRETKRERALLKRAKETKKRLEARKRAQVVLTEDELVAFMDQWNDDEERIVHEEKLEDDAYLVLTDEKRLEDKRELEALVNDAALKDTLESLDRPNAQRLEDHARLDVKKFIAKLDEARLNMRDMDRELEQTREAFKGDETKRGVIIMAESKVRDAAKFVTEAEKALKDGEIVLSRAIRRREKEDRYRPLFDALATSPEADYTASYAHLTAALVTACGDRINAKINFLFDHFHPPDSPHDLMRPDELMLLLSSAVRMVELVGKVSEPMSMIELRGIAQQCLLDSRAVKAGISKFEFRNWCYKFVQQSRDLCDLFGTGWRFQHMSRLQRQTMGAARQVELGLISIQDMKYRISREMLRYRPQLDPGKRTRVHELALAMGADDPLKPDYTRFLPRRHIMADAGIEPLEHGVVFTNALHYRRRLRNHAATKIQSIFRGARGRALAEMAAKMQAFFVAKGVALAQKRGAIEKQFDDRERSRGVTKIKWDAQVRMKQVQLKAQGQPMERDDVVQLMLDTAVFDSQKEVHALFLEMAIERGYATDDLQEPPSFQYLTDNVLAMAQWRKDDGLAQYPGVVAPTATPGAPPPPETPRSADSKAASSSSPSASSSSASAAGGGEAESEAESKAESKVESEVESEVESKGESKGEEASGSRNQESSEGEGEEEEEEAERGSDDSDDEDEDEEEEEEEEDEEEGYDSQDEERQRAYREAGAGAGSEDASSDDESEDPFFQEEEMDEEMIKSVAKVSAPDEIAAPEAKRMGETPEETARRESMILPSQSEEVLTNRLLQLAPTMTALKARNMLLEFPSKTLLLQWVRSHFHPYGTGEREAMQAYVIERYRLKESAAELVVLGLMSMLANDLELGIMTRYIKSFATQQDMLVSGVALKEVQTSNNRLANLKRRRKNFMKLTQPMLTDEEVEERLDERGDREVTRRAKAVLEAKAAVADALKRLGEAEAELDNAQKQKAGQIAVAHVGEHHRTDWMTRFVTAMEAPETTPDEVTSKYTELAAVSRDFHHYASMYGMTIIREHLMPPMRRSIRPVREAEVEGINGKRFTFLVTNIWFKLCTDDRGVFNGSDEKAAKWGGHEIKGSLAISKLHAQGIVVPLQACVDYLGFRVLAVAALPLSRSVVTEDGELRTVSAPLLFGTADRGETVKKNNKILEHRINQMARELNLAQHDVQGEKDVNRKSLSVACTLNAFKGADDQFYLMHFARLMPPEAPECTPHLVGEARGQSIFWRMLRPELVRRYKRPTSSDAYSMVTALAKDCDQQMDGARRATKFLVTEVIPKYAEALSKKETLAELDLVNEAHRKGINMRHLGALRSYFWRQLPTHVGLHFASPTVYPKESPVGDMFAGERVCINDAFYKVKKVTRTTILLDRPIEGTSKNQQTVFVGGVSTDRHSTELRMILAVEIAARALKNILRFFFREGLRNSRVFQAQTHNRLLVEFLNLVTGAHAQSEEFWMEQVYLVVLSRYGKRAFTRSERENLRTQVAPRMHDLVMRLAEMVGIRFTNDCMEAFEQHPMNFRFTFSDVLEAGLRVKHNLSLSTFADAMLISLRAMQTRVTSYSKLVLGDDPAAYWRLTERAGARVAVNIGAGGVALSGYYKGGVSLAHDGPIANEEPNRAVFLSPKEFGRVDTNYMAPTETDQAFSIELWAYSNTGRGMSSLVASCGRFAVCKTKDAHWALVLYESAVEVVLVGPVVEPETWTHLVGTFDTTMLRLYVNGLFCGALVVAARVAQHLEAAMDQEKAMADEVTAMERERISQAERDATSEAAIFFKTKIGIQRIKQSAKRLSDKSAFHAKLNPGKGLRRLTKKEAQTQAKNEYRSECLARHVVSANKDIQLFQDEMLQRASNRYIEARDRMTRHLRIGASPPTMRDKEGRKFFDGGVCHVAVYRHCLTRDSISTHYNSGRQSRGSEADRLFQLASLKYQEALKFLPDDRMILFKYAENVCGYLKSDTQRETDRESYKAKVRDALRLFDSMENLDGIGYILNNLPTEECYGDLVCMGFDVICKLDPEYFTDASGLTLRQLARFPDKFDLHGPGAEPYKVRVAADIIRLVVRNIELSTFYGDIPLSWLANIESDRAVVSFVHKADTDADMNLVEMEHHHRVIADIQDHEMDIVSANSRTATSFSLRGCTLLTDASVRLITHRCLSLRRLDLADCHLVTDAAVDAIYQNVVGLESINLAGCKNIADDALNLLFRFCVNLTAVCLNDCPHVCDPTMVGIAEYCRSIREVHVRNCVKVSDAGLELFALRVNSANFVTLDLGGCRLVGDAGVHALAGHCNRLTHLDLSHLMRVTDEGIKAVTHMLWDLKFLSTREIFYISDHSYLYDPLDGRKMVMDQMLTRIEELNLSDCNEITDRGVGGIASRCKNLRSLTLSACSKVSDKGVHYITVDYLSGAERGGQMQRLDLSFLPLVTDAAVRSLMERCRQLQKVNFSGCVQITDESLEQLWQRCAAIQSVSLAHCHRITDAAVASMVKFLWIEELDLSHCHGITDWGVEVVAGEFSGLTTLGLAWCRRISEAGLESLAKGCRFLSALDVSNIDQLGLPAVERLRALMPMCDIKWAEAPPSRHFDCNRGHDQPALGPLPPRPETGDVVAVEAVLPLPAPRPRMD